MKPIPEFDEEEAIRAGARAFEIYVAACGADDQPPPITQWVARPQLTHERSHYALWRGAGVVSFVASVVARVGEKWLTMTRCDRVVRAFERELTTRLLAGETVKIGGFELCLQRVGDGDSAAVIPVAVLTRRFTGAVARTPINHFKEFSAHAAPAAALRRHPAVMFAERSYSARVARKIQFLTNTILMYRHELRFRRRLFGAVSRQISLLLRCVDGTREADAQQILSEVRVHLSDLDVLRDHAARAIDIVWERDLRQLHKDANTFDVASLELGLDLD